MLIETADDNLDMTLGQLKEEVNVDFSKKTTWRVLKEHEYNYKTAPIKWWIPEKNREERLLWANEYLKAKSK